MAKDISKAPVQKRASVSAAPTRAPDARASSGAQHSIAVTAEQRQIMICEAAYFIAEHRGFEPGHDVDDWLAAERQIDAAYEPHAAGRGRSPATLTK
jgi:Protein of unknown function (DUF2934)